MKKNLAMKTLSIILAAVLLLAVIPVGYATPLLSFYIDNRHQNITLAVGQTFGPTFHYSPDMNFEDYILVSSSDEAVATASEYGTIHAHSVGTTTITYTPVDNPELAATCTVTVTEEGTSATLFMLSPHYSSIAVGSSIDVYFEYEPRYANLDVEINVTEGSEFVEINSNALGFVVTGIAPGNVEITATDKHSEKEYTLSFEVTPAIAVTGIEFNDDTYHCYVGDYPNFSIAFTPEDATNRVISFSSSDLSIIDVASEYSLVAKKEGTCVITATSQDGGFTDEITVIVTNRPEMTDIELSSYELTITRGNEEYIMVQPCPEDAQYIGVYNYSSSDESVVEVDEYGIVRAISVGTATVTISADDGRFSKNCEITVTPPVYPESITTEYTDVSLKVGQSYEPFLELHPLETTEYGITVSSSNPDVAGVYGDYYNISIFAESVGEAVITIASDVDPLVSIQITVTVTEDGALFDEYYALTGDKTVFLDNSLGSEFSIPIFFIPEYASNTEVEWVSDDDTIASYSDTITYGNTVYSYFTAKRPGSVTLTATLEDGTEIEFPVIITDEERQDIKLIDGADYSIVDSGYLSGVEEKTTLADFSQRFDSAGIIKVFDCNGDEITDENACIGTGAVVSLISAETGATHDRISIVVNGDVNGDAAITTDDARLVLRSTVGLEELYSEFLLAANVGPDGDDEITTDDARLILRYTVGLETEL